MNILTAVTKERTPKSISPAIQSGIEFHNRKAGYLMAAAAHHFRAANQLSNGNYANAANSGALANEYLNLATNSECSE